MHAEPGFTLMRRWLEGPIRRWWYGEDSPLGVVLTPVTIPFALLYGLVVRIRNALFDREVLPVRRGAIPVVSVGNLAVGGTGKTPVSRWLVDELRAMGRSPALVTRGYGEDEVLLHRRWHPSTPVIQAPERVEGVAAAAGRGADICVVDDGFQHRRLARDLDIVLVSVLDPLPARLLPRGPYREPLHSLRRADLVLVTSHGMEGMKEAERRAGELARRPGFPPVAPFPFQTGPWQTPDGRPGPPPPPRDPVLLVCSVARPEGVASLAREAGIQVAEVLAFPDHHPYSPGDLEHILRASRGRPIVTTEKDAVKLVTLDRPLSQLHVLTLTPNPAIGVERIVRELIESALDGMATTGGAPDGTGGQG